jgi:hypothetical protein
MHRRISDYPDAFAGLNFRSPPKPHAYVSLPLKSGLSELVEIISNIDSTLPLLSKFIDNFNTVVANNDINVITEVNGDMSIDVPLDMPKEKRYEISKKLGIIDRLVNTKGTELRTLFEQAVVEQDKLKALNSKDIPQISKQMQIFLDLNKSYKS